jgi:hypothetical protein
MHVTDPHHELESESTAKGAKHFCNTTAFQFDL